MGRSSKVQGGTMRVERPVAVISGATSGIGAALAAHYRAQGYRLILPTRQPLANLTVAASERRDYCVADLRQPEQAAQAIAGYLQQQAISHLDLLIHCAGLGQYGDPADLQPADLRDLLAVNLEAPLAISHELFPLLVRGRGKVVFISSVASALAVPRYAAYGASKAALDGLARSLRIEWRERVAVQVIHPGATRTAMHERSGIPLSAMRWDRFPPAERTAAAIAKAIAGDRAEVTIGGLNRLIRAWGRLGRP